LKKRGAGGETVGKARSFPCEFSSLGRIRDFVGRRGSRAGLSPQARSEVELCVDEAVTNTMRYGYPEGMRGRVSIETLVKDGRFVVRITDDGEQFDPLSVPEPDLKLHRQELRTHGLGVFIMRKFMDDIRYHARRSGNCLDLGKKLPRAGRKGRR
jgi:serine/threonine-protein kinase RsbW